MINPADWRRIAEANYALFFFPEFKEEQFPLYSSVLNEGQWYKWTTSTISSQHLLYFFKQEGINVYISAYRRDLTVSKKATVPLKKLSQRMQREARVPAPYEPEKIFEVEIFTTDGKGRIANIIIILDDLTQDTFGFTEDCLPFKDAISSAADRIIKNLI